MNNEIIILEIAVGNVLFLLKYSILKRMANTNNISIESQPITLILVPVAFNVEDKINNPIRTTYGFLNLEFLFESISPFLQ